jgi:hypothetical protein
MAIEVLLEPTSAITNGLAGIIFIVNLGVLDLAKCVTFGLLISMLVDIIDYPKFIYC